MGRLEGGEVVLDPELLPTMAQDAFAAGDEEVGGTLARAYGWTRARDIRQAAALN